MDIRDFILIHRLQLNMSCDTSIAECALRDWTHSIEGDCSFFGNDRILKDFVRPFNSCFLQGGAWNLLILLV